MNHGLDGIAKLHIVSSDLDSTSGHGFGLLEQRSKQKHFDRLTFIANFSHEHVDVERSFSALSVYEAHQLLLLHEAADRRNSTSPPDQAGSNTSARGSLVSFADLLSIDEAAQSFHAHHLFQQSQRRKSLVKGADSAHVGTTAQGIDALTIARALNHVKVWESIAEADDDHDDESPLHAHGTPSLHLVLDDFALPIEDLASQWNTRFARGLPRDVDLVVLGFSGAFQQFRDWEDRLVPLHAEQQRRAILLNPRHVSKPAPTFNYNNLFIQEANRLYAQLTSRQGFDALHAYADLLGRHAPDTTPNNHVAGAEIEPDQDHAHEQARCLSICAQDSSSQSTHSILEQRACMCPQQGKITAYLLSTRAAKLLLQSIATTGKIAVPVGM